MLLDTRVGFGSVLLDLIEVEEAVVLVVAVATSGRGEPVGGCSLGPADTVKERILG